MATQKLVIFNAVSQDYEVIWKDDADPTPASVTRKVGGYGTNAIAETHRVSGS
jgi:hypothetical protein